MSKEIIETLINSVAVILTGFGSQAVVSGNLLGYLAISFGVGLEYIKYKGRKMKLW
jgi:hypothetical protein